MFFMSQCCHRRHKKGFFVFFANKRSTLFAPRLLLATGMSAKVFLSCCYFRLVPPFGDLMFQVKFLYAANINVF